MDNRLACVLHQMVRDRKITVGGWKSYILPASSRVGRNKRRRGKGGTAGSIVIGPDAIPRAPDQRVSQSPLFQSS